jgi:hypothetical protein
VQQEQKVQLVMLGHRVLRDSKANKVKLAAEVTLELLDQLVLLE